MGHKLGTPLWAGAMTNVWRACWPVLLPFAVAVLGLVLGPDGTFARTAPVLVVAVGAALLTSRRFAALCVTTLACAVMTSGTGVLALSALVLEGVVSLPLVVAGRAVWAGRSRAKSRGVAVDSRLAATMARTR